MAGLSLARFYGFNMRGFDTGNISQSIWSATQGKPLIMTSGGQLVSRLSGNVEVFYLLLAPIYALFPSPAALLVVQAAFYAVGAVPLYGLAKRKLGGERIAVTIAAIYLLYPVAQTAVLFEFHADVLAMPLLLAAINAADRERWRSYSVWLFLALICKFYVAVPVGVMGIALWWRGQRWAGVATAVSAAAWLFFAFFVMRPLFAPEVTAPVVTASSSGVRFYGVTFGQLDVVRATAGERLANGLVLFFPVLLLAWRAPLWLLAAAAISLPVLLGNGPGPIYDYRYHHYAVAVPFLLAGLVYGLERLQKQRGWNEGRLPGYLKLSLIITLIFNVAFVDTPLSPIFYTAAPGSAMGLDSNGYRISGRDRFKRLWLADTVSPDAPLLTDHGLGLALLNRETLYIANQLSRPMAEAVAEVDEVALDALFDFSWLSANQVNFAGVIANREVIQFMLAESDFDLGAMQDGLLYFAQTGSGLLMQIETRPFPDTPIKHQFSDAIGLVDVQIEPVGGNRFQIQVDWVALRPLTDQPALIAVSRPGGLEHARIVHLPTLALLPTTEWPMDQIVREIFTFTLPNDTPPGEYPFLVGWYDTSSLYAAESDARSRIGDEVKLGVLTVP